MYGYKVTIAWYEGDDLRSQDLTVKGCPTGAYEDDDCDTLLDVDGDGITDRDETHPPYATQVDGILAGVLDFLEWLAAGVVAIGNLFWYP